MLLNAAPLPLELHTHVHYTPPAIVSTRVWSNPRVLPNSWSLRGNPDSLLPTQAFHLAPADDNGEDFK